MPSYARKHQLEGALIYHVYNRSHGKIFIFNDREDFEHFGGLLKAYKEKFQARIYHWVIMSNHYWLTRITIIENIKQRGIYGRGGLNYKP